MRTLFIPMFGDFAEETRDETNRWFDLDHVPQRLTCPGFVRAERYERVDRFEAGPCEMHPPRYLNVYHVVDPGVLESEAYHREVAALTPWTLRRTDSGTTGMFLRGVWVQQPDAVPARITPLRASEGPHTWLVRMQNTDDEDMPGMLSCPGIVAAERYASVAVDLPGPQASPPPGFMTIYVLEAPEVVSTPEYLAHAAPALWQGVYLQRPSPWTLRPAAISS